MMVHPILVLVRIKSTTRTKNRQKFLTILAAARTLNEFNPFGVLAFLTEVEAFYGAVIAHYAGVYYAFSPFFGQTF